VADLLEEGALSAYQCQRMFDQMGESLTELERAL
jgi:hypothetical protein